MANTYNWRFFQDTGKVGGTANPADEVFYVDSYNGSDLNVGSNAAPFQTIQKALDEMPGAGYDLMVAGYFEEGDFLNVRNWVGLVPEGDVVINGVNSTSFSLGYSCNWGYTFHEAGIPSYKNYGRLTIKNFLGNVGWSSSSGDQYIRGVRFENCSNMFSIYLGYVKQIVGNTFINCSQSDSGNAFRQQGAAPIIEGNNYINTVFFAFATLILRNNYFDATSRVSLNNLAPDIWANNFLEGTVTNKINNYTGGADYDNIEALQAAHPTVAVNDLPSTTVPLFNDVANDDWTLQEASPLVKAGYDKSSIGAHEVADISQTNPNSAKFDYVNIDTATTGEITLVSDGVGTATTKALYHHQIAPKKRLILVTHAPNLEQNFGLGEVMSHNLAADNTPPKTSIEIQYTTDTGTLVDGAVGSDDNYNGTWLAVPIGEQPFHDTVNNVGNDDPLFNIGNAVPIASKYVKMRITLRSNEVQI